MKDQEEILEEIQTAFLMDMAVSMAAFKEMCPEYVDTPENAAAISSFFPKQIHRAPTVLEIHAAYLIAIRLGKIHYGRPN